MADEKILNFMGVRKIVGAISLILVIGSLVSLAVNGLQFGLDFTGGTQLEVNYKEPANLDVVRQQLTAAGFANPVVVYFGAETDVLIKMQRSFEAGMGENIMQALNTDNAGAVLQRIEFVGPQVGEELRDDGGLAMLFALFVVMVYVGMRFQIKFAVASVIALIHDVIITLGFFSITKTDFDLTVLAAVLALIGYSINDTIVVFDRLRENFRKLRKGDSVEVINLSLTQTLGRTTVTSFTTVLTVVALFFFGGELIHGFSTALLIGIVVGTYSSIYIASSLLITMRISKEDLMLPEKEVAELDGAP